MVDHVTLVVGDLKKSLRFYRSALEPLGYVVESSDDTSAGLGPAGKPQLWLQEGKTVSRSHVAFKAPSRKAVDQFHAAALSNGGKDNGPPGVRESYSPTWYAAFAHDPDGNNIEAVIHTR
jgi:catechol 2,3-dioxygenase-like lactoylglutathione lyase family enzyme